MPALPGTITCYGGPGDKMGTPVEFYLRRAVDREKGWIHEDLVTLDGTGSTRTVTRFPFNDKAAGIGDLEEVNQHFVGGTAVVEARRAGEVSVSLYFHFDKWPTTYVLNEDYQDGHVVLVFVGDEATKAASLGLTVPTNEAQTTSVQDQLEKNGAKLSVQIRGLLAPIATEKCAEMFSHFKPASRAWPAPDGVTITERAMFDDPPRGATSE